MDKVYRVYLHIVNPDLISDLIIIWRWRLSIWLIDAGVALRDWVSPGGKRIDDGDK